MDADALSLARRAAELAAHATQPDDAIVPLALASIALSLAATPAPQPVTPLDVADAIEVEITRRVTIEPSTAGLYVAGWEDAARFVRARLAEPRS